MRFFFKSTEMIGLVLLVSVLTAVSAVFGNMKVQQMAP